MPENKAEKPPPFKKAVIKKEAKNPANETRGCGEASPRLLCCRDTVQQFLKQLNKHPLTQQVHS